MLDDNGRVDIGLLVIIYWFNNGTHVAMVFKRLDRAVANQ